MRILLFITIFLPLLAKAEMNFSRACEPGDSITIAAVGDVLLHAPLQTQSYQSPLLHKSLWAGVEELLQAADFSYANLEGPAAEGVSKNGNLVADPGMSLDEKVYSGFPLFNYHPSLITSLKESGFDILSTANNHALDRGSLGVDKTIAALNDVGMAFTGTRLKSQGKSPSFSWSTVTQKNGWNIAWIACTFSTNGAVDSNHQVLDCFKDEEEIKAEIKKLSIDSNIDTVIITPHWGMEEYTQKVEKSQRELGQRFFEAGATAIIGNHPHVTKPWEKYITSDARETFVIYSIGNFVSWQGALAKRTSAIIYLGLTKNGSGKAWINGVAYVPTYRLPHPIEVVAVDRMKKPVAAATNLLTSLLGVDRLVSSKERIVTNFECRK